MVLYVYNYVQHYFKYRYVELISSVNMQLMNEIFIKLTSNNSLNMATESAARLTRVFRVCSCSDMSITQSTLCDMLYLFINKPKLCEIEALRFFVSFYFLIIFIQIILQSCCMSFKTWQLFQSSRRFISCN